MSRGTGRSLERSRGKRLAKGLLVAGAAVGVPVLAGALLRRRAEPPALPRWGRTHRYAGRSGGEVVFQQLGSGPPVVLLHSFGPGYGAEQWRAAAEILAGSHSIYVPDLPGWGRTRESASGRPPDRLLSLIEDFLAGVVREPAAIVAAGLAAAYAVETAVAHQGGCARWRWSPRWDWPTTATIPPAARASSAGSWACRSWVRSCSTC